MPNPRFEVVLFDIGNVIIRASHDITYSYLIEKHGLDYKRAKLFYEHPCYREFARGRISGDYFFSVIVEDLCCNLNYRDVRKAHSAHMYCVDQDVLDIMRKISLDIAFATDTNEWQNEREKELFNPFEFSERAFRSNLLGALKTDSMFFPAVLKEFPCDPGRILLIDDVPDNIQTARNFDLSTHLYTGADNLKRVLENLCVI